MTRPYRSPPHAGGYTGNDPQLMEPLVPTYLRTYGRPHATSWAVASDRQIERSALQLLDAEIAEDWAGL